LHGAMQRLGMVPDGTQAAALKECSLLGKLDADRIDSILAGKKPKAAKVTLNAERIREYFTQDYTLNEIEEIIYQLLEKWKQEGGR